jgi:hypothetical protein
MGTAGGSTALSQPMHDDDFPSKRFTGHQERLPADNYRQRASTLLEKAGEARFHEARAELARVAGGYAALARHAERRRTRES